jgi:hypothetical protein
MSHFSSKLRQALLDLVCAVPFALTQAAIQLFVGRPVPLDELFADASELREPANQCAGLVSHLDLISCAKKSITGGGIHDNGLHDVLLRDCSIISR